MSKRRRPTALIVFVGLAALTTGFLILEAQGRTSIVGWACMAIAAVALCVALGSAGRNGSR